MNYQMPSTRGDFYKQLVENREDEPEPQVDDDPEPDPINNGLIHDNEEEGVQE